MVILLANMYMRQPLYANKNQNLICQQQKNLGPFVVTCGVRCLNNGSKVVSLFSMQLFNKFMKYFNVRQYINTQKAFGHN